MTNTAQILLTELPANLGSAAALVPALEWAKRSQMLKWINERTAPWVSVGSAFAVAAGIHGAVTATGFHLDGTWSGLLVGSVSVFKQWLGQHWTYKIYQTFDTVKSLAVAINKLANVPTPSVTGASAPPKTE